MLFSSDKGASVIPKAENVQRCVCYVNVQVPCPHSNSRLFCFCAHGAWTMPGALHLSCGIPIPIWTPDNISGLPLVVVWLSSRGVIKKITSRTTGARGYKFELF